MSCPVRFKSLECGYKGNATWCDRSQKRCTELKNEHNFGGRVVRWWQRPVNWWNIGGAALLLATVSIRPHWPVAAAMYLVSAIVLLPESRSEVIVWCIRAYRQFCHFRRLRS